MGIPKTIKIGDGKNGKIDYYYWDNYDGYKEAVRFGKRIKEERKKEGIKLKYFILETQDSWFLPVPKFVLYFNKKLKII